MKREQYVCLVCGFNMIGFHPDRCPFCGEAKNHFSTACGYNYVIGYDDWKRRFSAGPLFGGH